MRVRFPIFEITLKNQNKKTQQLNAAKSLFLPVKKQKSIEKQ